MHEWKRCQRRGGLAVNWNRKWYLKDVHRINSVSLLFAPNIVDDTLENAPKVGQADI